MGDYLKGIRKLIGHQPIIVPHSLVVLFNDEDEVLLIERTDDGYFDFPGGGIDLAETSDFAAKRELFEETGIIADEITLFKVYTGEITHYVYANGDEIYGTDFVYICNKWHGELKGQIEEVKSLGFYPTYSLPNRMSKRNRLILNEVLKVYAVHK